MKITEEKSAHLDDILVGEGLVGFVVLGVLEKNLVHVGAGILIQLVTRAEDNQGNLAVAQNRQLVRLLHYPELPFVEGHLSIDRQESISVVLTATNSNQTRRTLPKRETDSTSSTMSRC